LKCRK